MKYLTSAIAVLAFSVCAGLSVGHAQQLCQGLEGEERRACLQVELDQNRRETENAERRIRRLDKAIRVTCTARTVGGITARGAGKAVGGPIGGAAAGAVWGGTNSAGDRAARNQHPCTPRAE